MPSVSLTSWKLKMRPMHFNGGTDRLAAQRVCFLEQRVHKPGDFVSFVIFCKMI